MLLKIDSTFPDFTFDTQNEQNLTTEDVLKEADRTVFWVLRYIGCPTCRYDVHQIMLNYDRFLERNTRVCVVMQSDPAIVRRDTKGYTIPFHIICDQKQEIYSTLDIRATETPEERDPITEEDKEKLVQKFSAVRASGFTHGDYEGNEQQLPAMFIVDKNAKVLYAHYATNKIDMPTVDETLNLLDSLSV